LGLRTEERVEREKKTEEGGDLFRGRRDLGFSFGLFLFKGTFLSNGSAKSSHPPFLSFVK
jgi:hypothetical protein